MDPVLDRNTSRKLTGFGPPRTLFDADTGEWLQKDSSDPVDGWPVEAVKSSGMNHGIPEEDRYGRLYFYVRDKLETFCRRIASAKKHRFHLYCVSAADLPVYLDRNIEKLKFDRVEVANIAEMTYLGLEKTLQTCGSLLKTPAMNPHATLIVLFMNAIHYAEQDLGQDYVRKSLKSAVEKTMKFLPPSLSSVSNKTGAEAMRMIAAKDIFRDTDHLFGRYMKMENFDKVTKEAGLRMKTANTVIDAWPLRLRKGYGEPGAQEAFDRLIESGSAGNERYVEWARSG